MSEEGGFRGQMTKRSEEAIGKLAQELLENSIVTSALSAAFETRERAMRAQELAMGALNLPSASDLERLTRRVRSVSQRLEGIEDGLDRLDTRLERSGSSKSVEERLGKIEAALERLEAANRQAASNQPAARPASRPAAKPASSAKPVRPAKPASPATPAKSG